MADDFSINGRLDFDTSGFNQSIEKVSDKLEQFGGKFDDSTEKVGKGAKSWGLDLDKFYNQGSSMFKKFGIDIDKFAGHFGVKGKLVAAIAVAISALVKLGKAMDECTQAIARGTGSTGEELTQLQFTAENALVNGVGRSAKEAGEMVADLNTRFGVTGETLEALTLQFDKFSNVTGTDTKTAINDIADIEKRWNIQTEQTNALLDQLTKASQMSGATVSELMNDLSSGQVYFQQFGLSATESVAMLASFQQNGIKTQTVLTGMRTALNNFTADGKNATTAFKDVITQIQEAKTDADALAISIDTFGQKAGAEMVQALRSGTASINEYTKALENAGQTVNKTEEASRTMKDAWNDLKSALVGTFGEFGQGFTNLFRDIIDTITNFVRMMQPIIQPIGNIFKSVFSFIGEVIKWFSDNVRLMVTQNNGYFKTMVSVLRAVAEGVRNILGSFLDIFKGVFGTIFAILGGKWDLAWVNMKITAMSVGKAVLDIVSLLGNALGAFLNLFVKGINNIIDGYNQVADLMGWKKGGHVSEFEHVDLADTTGLKAQIEKEKAERDRLMGVGSYVGDLGSIDFVDVPDETGAITEIEDYAVTSSSATQEKILQNSSTWTQRRLQQQLDAITKEKEARLKEAQENGATQEELDAINQEYAEKQIELYTQISELKKAKDLESVQNYANAEEEKAQLNEYYETDIADYTKSVNVNAYEAIKTESDETTDKITDNNDKVKKSFAETVKDIASKVRDVVNKVGNAFSRIYDFMQLDPDEMIDKMLEFADNVLTFFTETMPRMPELAEAGVSMLTSLFSALTTSEMIQSIAGLITEALPKIIHAVVSNLGSIMQAIGELTGAIIEALVQSLFEINWGEVLKGIFTGIWNGIKGLFTGLWSGIKKIFTGGYATGTNNAVSGLRLVGEQGPELIDMHGGERVYNAANTAKILSGSNEGGNSFNVTFNNVQDTSAYAMMKQLKAYNRQMAINGVI